MEETRPKRSSKKPEPRSREQLIVAYWKELGRPPVGGRELSAIQAELNQRFGGNAINSPAAIARVLADEGAALRHPEVIECDVLWRAGQIRETEQRMPEVGGVLTLTQAEEWIGELEKLRIREDPAEAQSVRSMAIEARERAKRHARRTTLSQRQRAEQNEIAEWLGVWIKTPGLFEDWLELRRRSPDFRRRFSNE
jgi:hypothetical protein